MIRQDRIALNFLAIKPSEFRFEIFRRLMAPPEQSITGQRNLPIDLTGNSRGQRGRYEISFERREGFDPAEVSSRLNSPLTIDVIFRALRARCASEDLKDSIEWPPSSFAKRLAVVTRRHSDGIREVMWVRPYHLRAANRFGLLLKFSLRVPQGSLVPIRRIQELSLSQKGGRTNEDFYEDQYQKVADFLRTHHSTLSPLALHDGTKVEVDNVLSTLESYVLDTRTYVFGGGREGRNQFFGLRDFGPFGPTEKATKLAFLFQSGDRANSQDLFRALRGDTYQTFGGMKDVFRTPIGQENVTGIEVPSFNYADVKHACERLKQEHPAHRILPIALVPFSKHVSEEMTLNYYRAKHAILSAGLASQFVDRLKTMGDRDALKWSVSNIALATFAKMGGVPWRVRPSTEKCLIVGIGQAHRWIDDRIEKYVAYSVLTDSSGAYESIKVLGSSTDQKTYIAALKQNLEAILLEHQDRYDSFVIHVTFSLRKIDIQAIKEILEKVRQGSGDGREFVVLKFNDQNDFFGFSTTHNSRIPYEGTVVELSKREFVVWFGGLGVSDSRAPRKPERPVHIDVMYPEETSALPDLRRLLQDSINIAGANWRGFNAKSMPISVYYAKLIADHYARFREAGLEDIDMDELHPWFL